MGFFKKFKRTAPVITFDPNLMVRSYSEPPKYSPSVRKSRPFGWQDFEVLCDEPNCYHPNSYEKPGVYKCRGLHGNFYCRGTFIVTERHARLVTVAREDARILSATDKLKARANERKMLKATQEEQEKRREFWQRQEQEVYNRKVQQQRRIDHNFRQHLSPESGYRKEVPRATPPGGFIQPPKRVVHPFDSCEADYMFQHHAQFERQRQPRPPPLYPVR